MARTLNIQLPLLFVAIALTLGAQPPAAATPKTTDVLVMLTVKPGVAREQILNVMPEEVRDTVRLYLAGKIRQWYSRSDGKGVIFILDCKDVSEAQSIMEQLPLAKQKLADYEFTAMSPLAPLSYLLGSQPGSTAPATAPPAK
jgi:hypothetical protein